MIAERFFIVSRTALVPQIGISVPPEKVSAQLSQTAQFMMQKIPFLCLMLVC
jgi:hypothetical protein